MHHSSVGSSQEKTPTGRQDEYQQGSRWWMTALLLESAGDSTGYHSTNVGVFALSAANLTWEKHWQQDGAEAVGLPAGQDSTAANPASPESDEAFARTEPRLIHHDKPSHPDARDSQETSKMKGALAVLGATRSLAA